MNTDLNPLKGKKNVSPADIGRAAAAALEKRCPRVSVGRESETKTTKIVKGLLIITQLVKKMFNFAKSVYKQQEFRKCYKIIQYSLIFHKH